MDYNTLMQTFVNKPYDELLALAKQAVANVLPACKLVDEEHNGIAMLTAILLSAVAADGKLTRLEAQFLSDITGLDAAGIDKMTDMYTSKMVDVTDLLADKGGNELKAHICMLIVCLASCDETINHEENAFIRQIMA
ncbi:MAG: hypothetical protein IJN04_04820 [Clostridia bacterium]|nr:hypothetical protein [Clostridia bacterium]